MPAHNSSTTPSSTSSSSSSSSRRRFSLASFTSSSTSFSSSPLRRLSSSSDQPLPSSTETLPAVPFADPPYMPMFKSTISPSTKETSQGGGGERKQETLHGLSTLTSPPSQSGSTYSSSSPAPSTSRHSHRFFRRLQHKRGNGKTELDFGCVGDWNEGPSDLSSSYYDSHNSNRNSAASSIEFSHSRGHSSSSSVSYSTAASSLPPSPTLPCDATLGPHHSSRVPLSPRTVSKKRQSEKADAVDALNDYFIKVRLSQIEEDAPVHHSISIGDSSYSAPPSSPPSFSSYSIQGGHGDGLAIFDSSNKKAHDRSPSRDIEIEFIETGHTTFTPLSADSPSYSSVIVLPEDVFFASSFEGICYDIDMGGEDDLSTSTCTTSPSSRRTQIPEKEIGPALDELSTFFSSPPTQSSSPVLTRSSRFISPPSSPHLYSRSRRPDSFQAARQSSSQSVRYDWI
ncbi:uncharacterized protein JCM6883_007310 [Sporobolomyces salmoneus]|uniref:uncharacterized protein n=1 Tax=Sporobolomyces salmoneus TaxID=183962 RepID=UPI00316C2C3A